jgi:hypothetical protein
MPGSPAFQKSIFRFLNSRLPKRECDSSPTWCSLAKKCCGRPILSDQETRLTESRSPEAYSCAAEWLNENANSIQQGDPSFDDMSMADARKWVAQLIGNSKADNALAVLGRTQCQAPSALEPHLRCNPPPERDLCRRAEGRPKGRPVYNHWFQWQSPVLDRRARAYHTSELPFCFNNTARLPHLRRRLDRFRQER